MKRREKRNAPPKIEDYAPYGDKDDDDSDTVKPRVIVLEGKKVAKWKIPCFYDCDGWPDMKLEVIGNHFYSWLNVDDITDIIYRHDKTLQAMDHAIVWWYYMMSPDHKI